MADFNDEDRDRIRDYFGYTWNDNKLIADTLKTAQRKHGSAVVEYVQDRLDSLETLEATIGKALSSGNGSITGIDVDQEIAITYAPGGLQAGNYQNRQKLLNEIAAAIDFYMNSYTPLERS